MAKGDTKTNQYLDIAANGTRADFPASCCETRSQTLIREVGERIMDLEDEVERLENNPDVADIVATYADLQSYDTSQLTDKDVIRVLQDETHDGDSTYYRWSTSTNTWTYIGESKQYTDFVGTDGTTAGTAGLVPAPATTDTDKYLKSDGTWAEVQGGGGGTNNFNQLTNRPSYNGTTMTGSTDIPEVKTYTAGTNISISAQNEISATDTTYTAGTGLDLTDTTFSADTTVLATKTDLEGKQDELTAGDNVTIEDESGALVISATDTTYSDFTGTDGSSAGAAGLVPAPATTDAGKFLKADGTWDTAGGSSVNVVQTTGTSTTDVMSQNAVTSMVFADPSTARKVDIGYTGSSVVAGLDSVAIGHNKRVDGGNAIGIGTFAYSRSIGSVAIGYNATVPVDKNGAIALGAYSGGTDLAAGEMNIGSTAQGYGYNNSSYRLLTGLYDPQSAHDAATKGYVDPTTDSSAPTTATVGRLGQIFIDTTNADAYMCVAVDSVTPSYTWKKLNA